jgi:cytochrome b6-f complex iron-sulfur subunit
LVESAGQEPTEAAATDPAESASSRRRFFRHAWLVLGGLAVLEYVWVVINFLRPRASLAEEGGIVIAGPVERFEPGTVTAFQRGKFYLTRLEEGGFLAISRECTHLGCTVPWSDEEGRFVCPCHSSEYNEKGEVVSPPAPRPLDLFPVRIENDVVKVDTSEPQKRLKFEDAQVTSP